MNEPTPASPSKALRKMARAVGEPERLKLAERRRRVAQLRMRHMSVREIARLLEVSTGTVGNDIKIIEAEWHEETFASVEKHIAKDIAILAADEAMLRNQMASTPHIDQKLRVYDRILRVIERRAKMLGLESPMRLELAHAEARKLAAEFDLDEAELIKMAEEILAANRGSAGG